MRPQRLLSRFRTPRVPGRRRFLKGAAAAWLAVVWGIGCNDSAPAAESGPKHARAAVPPAGPEAERYQSLLGQVAAAVFPSRIRPEEARRIAAAFSAWLAAYDPNTEPVQLSTYDYTPNADLTPYPKSRIEADLREIESRSMQEFSRPFEKLDLAEQQSLLRKIVARYPAESVRGWIFRQDGHVVLSLLDFFYDFPMVYRPHRKK